MKLNIKLQIITLLVTVLFYQCTEKNIEPSKGKNSFESLQIPDGFEFNTATSLKVSISDENAADKIFYQFFSVDETGQKHLIVSGVSISGKLTLNFTVPAAMESIRLERNHQGNIYTETLPVYSNTVYFDYHGQNERSGKDIKSTNTVDRSGCYETLYAVNGEGGFYTINNESGNYEEIVMQNLEGGGSIACAVDRANRKMYYNTNTTLRYYDIDNQTFHVVANGNPFNSSYPRMEYNNTNGLLYIAQNEKMYIINPENNNVESEYDIIGLESPVNGGDMAISLDGTIYMCAFSGLYRINIEGANANATRISAENLPFSPTSMAIDRNDRLYLATNDANSQLIEMDKFDGAWAVVKTYNHKINDLGSLPCSQSELDQTDSDGDGVIDVNDRFPDDANKAFEIFTPSELGWGSLGFEDNWPHKGDYDFNDLVIAYRFVSIANSTNQIVALKMKFRIKALNGVYQNGFGIELPVSPDVVTNVTGHRLTKQLPTLDANGLELNQNKAVIMIFDNAYDLATAWTCSNGQEEEMELTVTFVSPMEPSTLGSAPFNPFIFIDGTREREVHLFNQSPTSLAGENYFGTADDNSNIGSNTYYQTINKHPWAINIIHDFKSPLEGIDILNGYNHFRTWAEQGGTVYADWYKDNSGYRNENQLCGN